MAGQEATGIGALDDPSGVGPRVTALRRAQGLSLSALARRAGVGKATLSGLEAGTRNPTLETLQSVAAALGVPITTVVAGSRRLRGRAVEVDVVHTFVDGEVSYEFCRLRIPAGAAQTSPAHSPGATEHVIVFAGVLEAGVVERPGRAAVGESLEWPADVPHGYAAIGAADVDASLVIRTPRG